MPNADACRFLPAVGLMRIRELVARYPEFRAEPEFSVYDGRGHVRTEIEDPSTNKPAIE
jgi:hypothetical protein